MHAIIPLVPKFWERTCRGNFIAGLDASNLVARTIGAKWNFAGAGDVPRCNSQRSHRALNDKGFQRGEGAFWAELSLKIFRLSHRNCGARSGPVRGGSHLSTAPELLSLLAWLSHRKPGFRGVLWDRCGCNLGTRGPSATLTDWGRRPRARAPVSRSAR